MDKYYSYTEFMKAVGKNKTASDEEKLLDEIYLDLFLNHVHREQRTNRLLTLIDAALDRKDEEAFLQYTSELRRIEDEHKVNFI